jgi:hypothetical protein
MTKFVVENPGYVVEDPGGIEEQPQQPAPRSIGGEVVRQAGLTGRAAVTGAAALPAMGADAMGYLLNLGIQAYNQKTGSNIPEFRPQAQVLEQNLSAAGLPQPESATERVVYDVNRGLTSAATMMGAASATAPTSVAGQGVRGALISAPVTQLQAAGGAAGASGVTREMGGGPVAQTVAALGGAVTVPAAVETTKSAGRTVVGLVAPFTRGGREKIVGRTMSSMASDATKARSNLESADDIVSEPTTAQASRDVGLAGLERTLKSTPAGAQFAERASKANDARTILLAGVAKDKQAIEAAEAARDASTAALRETAFKGGTPVSVSSVSQNIDDVLSGPSGNRLPVEKAMAWLKGRLDTVHGDPKRLYNVRKDINDAIAGKFEADNSGLRLASAELIKVRNVIDKELERSAPGFKNYLTEYAKQSKPINQMETLQDVSSRVVNAGTDIAGNQIISQAKWFNVVTKNKDELAKVLDKGQMKVLERVGKDLDRGAFSDYGKATGSNTYQNLSTANVLGAALGGRVNMPAWLQTLSRPLQWVYRVPDERMQELMVEAMLDPKLGRMLLEKADKQNMIEVSRALAIKARAMGIGFAQSEPQSKARQGK